MILDSGALVDVTDCCGHSPLYSTIRAGNETLARYLVEEADADPNLYSK